MKAVNPQNQINTYLQRDIPAYRTRIRAETLRRLWTMLAHPVVGNSWEGFVVEALLNAAPINTSEGFYRTSNGAEIDLVMNVPGHGVWAIEIKRGPSSPPKRGFYSACEDIQPARRLVVYSAGEAYPLGTGVEAVGLRTAVELLRGCRLGL